MYFTILCVKSGCFVTKMYRNVYDWNVFPYTGVLGSADF